LAETCFVSILQAFEIAAPVLEAQGSRIDQSE